MNLGSVFDNKQDKKIFNNTPFFYISVDLGFWFQVQDALIYCMQLQALVYLLF